MIRFSLPANHWAIQPKWDFEVCFLKPLLLPNVMLSSPRKPALKQGCMHVVSGEFSQKDSPQGNEGSRTEWRERLVCNEIAAETSPTSSGSSGARIDSFNCSKLRQGNLVCTPISACHWCGLTSPASSPTLKSHGAYLSRREILEGLTCELFLANTSSSWANESSLGGWGGEGSRSR